MSSTPDLGGQDDEAAAGDHPPGGAQAVPVQDGADGDAVAERDGRRAVPRLHDGRVVLVEGALVLAHVVALAERLRHHHHERVLEGPAAGDEQLQHVVEDARVALPRLDHRAELPDVIAKKGRGHGELPRVHLVDVAAQGVDLAVVRDVAEGLRQGPRGERVRAVALVDHRQGALEIGVPQVGVEALELRGDEHSLVHDRAGGEGVDVQLLHGEAFRGGHGLDDLARDVQLPLQRVPGELAEGDECLGNVGHGGEGQLARAARGWRGPRASRGRRPSPGGDRVLDELPRPRALLIVARAGTASPRRRGLPREGEPEALRFAREEAVGHLHEHARPVPRAGIAADRAAVHEVFQYRDAVARRSGACACRRRSPRTRRRSWSARRRDRTALRAAS